MKLLEIEVNSDKLRPVAKSMEDVFIDADLSNKEVFCLCLFYLVKAADQLELTKNSYLINCSNYWDADSVFSSLHNRDNLQ
jgi:hypothetical protein